MRWFRTAAIALLSLVGLSLSALVAQMVIPVLSNLLSAQIQPFLATIPYATEIVALALVVVVVAVALIQRRVSEGQPDRSIRVSIAEGTHEVRSRAEIPEPDPIVGRESEMDKAIRCLSDNGAQNLVVIEGMTGIGKTQFAYALAMHLKLTYQSQILLRVSEGHMVTPESCLIHCVAASADSAIPSSMSSLRAKYYDALKGTSTLILVDNLGDRELLDELLPPPESCAIVVTTRIAFSHTACAIDLGPLNRTDSAKLVQSNASGLLPSLATDLAEICGGHPLALRVAGAYIANNPSIDVVAFIYELRRVGPVWRLQLDYLFRRAYDDLSARNRTALHQLMVLRAPFELQIGEHICDTGSGSNVVLELAANHFLDRQGALGKFSFHELVRDFVQRSSDSSVEVETNGAVERLISYGVGALFQKHNEWYGADRTVSRNALRYFDSHRELLLDALAAAYDRNIRDAYLIMAKGLTPFAPLRLTASERIRISAQMLIFAREEGAYEPQLDALQELGQANMFEGNAAEAISSLENGLRIAEDNADTLAVARFSNLLSQVYFLLGERQKSASLIVEGEITEGSQTGIAAAINKSRLASADGKYEQALTTLLGILQGSNGTLTDSVTIQLHREIGHVYSAQREQQKAREQYEKGLVICRECGLSVLEGLLQLDLAASWREVDDYEMALEHVRNAQAIFPKTHENLIRNADAVAAALKLDAPPWMSEPDSSKRAISYSQYGHYASQHGYLEIARNSYGVALRIDPACCEAIGGLGWTLHLLHDDLSALDLIGSAVRCDPKSVDHRNNLAAIQLDSGQYAEAVTSARGAISLDAAFGPAYLNCGLALLGLNQTQAAMACFEEGIRHSAPLAKMYYNLGVLLSQANRKPEAVWRYEQAIWCDPDYVNAIYNLGVLRSRSRRNNEAANLYRRVLELRPTHEEAAANLAQILESNPRLR